jgi:hypothetical protein
MVKVISKVKMFYDEVQTLSKSQIHQLQLYGLNGFNKKVTESQFQHESYQHSFKRFGIQWFMRQKFDGEYVITSSHNYVEDWEKTHVRKHLKVMRELNARHRL